MRSVERAEDVFEDDVRAFPGLLSAFLYCDLDEVFRQFVQNNWNSLGALSHRELLVLVPEMEPSQQRRPKNRTDLIRAFRRLTRWNRESAVITVSDHFGIKISDFPCMVFFKDPSCREVYCFSFGNNVSEASLSEDIKAIFGKCRQVVSGRGQITQLDEAKLIDERAAMLMELVPQLRRMKIFRSVKELILSRPVNNALRIGSNVARAL
jgi:hypothetical protein